MPSNRLFRIARTGWIETTGAAKHEAEADLIHPDPGPQRPGQDLPIQELEKSSQPSAPHLASNELRRPRSRPERCPPLRRAPDRPAAPPSVPAGGRLLSTTSSRGFDEPHSQPCGWRRCPREGRPPSSAGRRQRKADSPTSVPLGTQVRSPPFAAERPAVFGLLRSRSPSNRQAMTSLAPPTGDDRPARLRSHPHSKAVGPAASASIWLERSFHFVMTLRFRRWEMASTTAANCSIGVEAKPAILLACLPSVNRTASSRLPCPFPDLEKFSLVDPLPIC